MKKTILATSLALGASVFFTGCGYNSTAVDLNHNPEICEKVLGKFSKDTSVCDLVANNEVIGFDARGDSSMLTHISYNNSTRAAIQVASDFTDDTGYKYFAFAHPAPISNFKGSLINNTKDYLDKCEINAGNVLTFNTDPCKLHPRIKREATVAIVRYKERPSNVLVYDANEVLSYLEEKGLYDPGSSIGKYKKLKPASN